jgi:hypothetical protein
MKTLLCAALVALSVGPASAAIVVDGVRDSDYGSPLSLQTVNARYGDEDGIGAPNGSELDAAYAKIEGGRLFLLLTGNLQNNTGNKVSVFFDSVAGGENTLTNIPDYDSMTGGNWRSNTLGGLTFDPGFTVDYHLIVRQASSNLEVDFVNRNGGLVEKVPGSKGLAPILKIIPGPLAQSTTSLVTSVGTVAAGSLGPNASASALTQTLSFGFDNSNTMGITGTSGPPDTRELAADQVAAAAVTKGLEFSIDLADLGSPAQGTAIKVTAVLGNGDFNDFSNNFLGGLPAPHAKFPAASLPFNLANEAGDQFFTITVVPEANSVLFGLSATSLLVFRGWSRRLFQQSEASRL